MSKQRHKSGTRRRWMVAAMLALALTMVPAWKCHAQAAANKQGTGAEVTLDRLVATVNDELILESDLDEERRFAAFQPFSQVQATATREELIDRLIDRRLIVQQMKLQPEAPITDAEVDTELVTLRKNIPKCVAYHCETEAGWEKFVADQGFSVEELRERWRVRMEVLRFIEERFRMGIRIDQSEIDDYYKTTMLPAYQKEGVVPPVEATITDHIREVLLEQRVTKLMDDWLTALRAQGEVMILKPGEEAP